VEVAAHGERRSSASIGKEFDMKMKQHGLARALFAIAFLGASATTFAATLRGPFVIMDARPGNEGKLYATEKSYQLFPLPVRLIANPENTGDRFAWDSIRNVLNLRDLETLFVPGVGETGSIKNLSGNCLATVLVRPNPVVENTGWFRCDTNELYQVWTHEEGGRISQVINGVKGYLGYDNKAGLFDGPHFVREFSEGDTKFNLMTSLFLPL
jgi:hypothetical protein